MRSTVSSRQNLATRESVERRLAERFGSSAGRAGPDLVGILSELWGLRQRRGRAAFAVREEIRRRMRWERTVEAREDALDRDRKT